MFVETKKEGEAPVKNKWREALLKAVDVIEQRGWCQGEAHNAAGEHCLFGALYLARYGKEPVVGAFTDPDWHEAFKIMGSRDARWNDSPGRTEDEVVAALRDAANACK